MSFRDFIDISGFSRPMCPEMHGYAICKVKNPDKIKSLYRCRQVSVCGLCCEKRGLCRPFGLCSGSGRTVWLRQTGLSVPLYGPFRIAMWAFPCCRTGFPVSRLHARMVSGMLMLEDKWLMHNVLRRALEFACARPSSFRLPYTRFWTGCVWMFMQYGGRNSYIYATMCGGLYSMVV